MSASADSRPLVSRRGGALTGSCVAPGDKSISHRALMLGALAVGETRARGVLEGEDVLRTAAAMAAMGAEIERIGPGDWRIVGRGVGGLREPDDVLDMGNSGTGARLLMGVIGGHGMTATLTGDASLRGRPMGRVLTPLADMGVRAMARSGGRLPLTLAGSARPAPLRYRPPVASAQVKSAILLAGLTAPGETTVIEPTPTRDHTERMLRWFGGAVTVADAEEGRAATVTGEAELIARDVDVPGDPSSAAFPLCAALIVPGSDVVVRHVGLNPLRAGLYDTLREMGADLAFETPREAGGEPVADLRARFSALKGVEVPPERAASMIDEYPVLAALAAFAEGTTTMRGVGELRVKESDRLDAMARGLEACGVAVEESEDTLIVHGRGADGVPGGARIESRLDHRIAMAFLVAGLASRQPIAVDDAAPIATSFPTFERLMSDLGGEIAPPT